MRLRVASGGRAAECDAVLGGEDSDARARAATRGGGEADTRRDGRSTCRASRGVAASASPDQAQQSDGDQRREGSSHGSRVVSGPPRRHDSCAPQHASGPPSVSSERGTTRRWNRRWARRTRERQRRRPSRHSSSGGSVGSTGVSLQLRAVVTGAPSCWRRAGPVSAAQGSGKNAHMNEANPLLASQVVVRGVSVPRGCHRDARRRAPDVPGSARYIAATRQRAPVHGRGVLLDRADQPVGGDHRPATRSPRLLARARRVPRRRRQCSYRFVELACRSRRGVWLGYLVPELLLPVIIAVAHHAGR